MDKQAYWRARVERYRDRMADLRWRATVARDHRQRTRLLTQAYRVEESLDLAEERLRELQGADDD